MSAGDPGSDRPIIEFRFDQVPGERAATLSIGRPDGMQFEPIRFGNVAESALRLRQRLPDILAPLREVVGHEGVLLDKRRGRDAGKLLYNVGGQIVEALVDDNSGRQVLAQLRTQVAGLFEGTAPFGSAPAPLVRVTASGADELASLLPIEFLPIACDILDRGNVRDCAQAFLGFRALIFRDRIEDRSRIIRRGSDGRIGTRLMLHDDPAIEAVRDQRRFFDSYPNIFATATWPDQRHDPNEQSFDAFVRCLTDKSEIVHLCSYFGAMPNSSDSRFDFGSVRVRVSQVRGAFNDLDPKAPRPFLFLNACSTGAVDNWDDSLIKVLVRHLFTDLIAAETLLPQAMAAAFCDYFYKRLLAPPPVDIAKALLGARYDLLRAKNNPGGILYRYYGTPRLSVLDGPTIDPEPKREPEEQPAVVPGTRSLWQRFGERISGSV